MRLPIFNVLISIRQNKSILQFSQIEQLNLQQPGALLLEAVSTCQASIYSVHERHSVRNPERKRRREEKVGIARPLT